MGFRLNFYWIYMITILSLLSLVDGRGFLETNFREFVNFEGRRMNGDCCEKSSWFDWSFGWGATDTEEECSTECDHTVIICIGNVTHSSSMSECEYGQKDIISIGGNNISFSRHVGEETNPIRFPFQQWPGEVKIKIDVLDEDRKPILVDHYEYQLNTEPLPQTLGTPVKELTLSGRGTKLDVDLRVFCEENFYGPNCGIYCKETDDVTGHYNCDPQTGDKICKTGWMGDDCLTNIDDCLGNRCYFGSTCVDGINYYTCACQPGRTGPTCEAEINECASQPCQNDGKCLDEDNAFICECQLGYTGLLCESEINECFSYPCENGGNCVDDVASYSCICPTGFIGNNCQIDADECAFNPCAQASRCYNVPGDYVCECYSGYTGKQCDVEIDECNSEPCQNGGICIDREDGYTCRCDKGFTGLNCGELVDHCSPNYCRNGATCHSGRTQFVCECPPQFTGVLCRNDVDECANYDTRCSGRGACTNTHGGYICDCMDGYEGTDCDIEIDECESSAEPCLNGGICIDEIGKFTCECVEGFDGDHCEIDIDECLSSPCGNNGSCIDRIAGFTCNCDTGYTGVNCEVLVQTDSASKTTEMQLSTDTQGTKSTRTTHYTIRNTTTQVLQNNLITEENITSETTTSRDTSRPSTINDSDIRINTELLAKTTEFETSTVENKTFPLSTMQISTSPMVPTDVFTDTSSTEESLTIADTTTTFPTIEYGSLEVNDSSTSVSTIKETEISSETIESEDRLFSGEISNATESLIKDDSSNQIEDEFSSYVGNIYETGLKRDAFDDTDEETGSSFIEIISGELDESSTSDYIVPDQRVYGDHDDEKLEASAAYREEIVSLEMVPGESILSGSGDEATMSSGEIISTASGNNINIVTGESVSAESGDEFAVISGEDLLSESGNDLAMISGENMLSESGDEIYLPDGIRSTWPGDDLVVIPKELVSTESGDGATISGETLSTVTVDVINMISGETVYSGSGEDVNRRSGDIVSTGFGDDTTSGEAILIESGDEIEMISGEIDESFTEMISGDLISSDELYASEENLNLESSVAEESDVQETTDSLSYEVFEEMLSEQISSGTKVSEGSGQIFSGVEELADQDQTFKESVSGETYNIFSGQSEEDGAGFLDIYSGEILKEEMTSESSSISDSLDNVFLEEGSVVSNIFSSGEQITEVLDDTSSGSGETGNIEDVYLFPEVDTVDELDDSELSQEFIGLNEETGSIPHKKGATMRIKDKESVYSGFEPRADLFEIVAGKDFITEEEEDGILATDFEITSIGFSNDLTTPGEVMIIESGDGIEMLSGEIDGSLPEMSSVDIRGSGELYESGENLNLESSVEEDSDVGDSSGYEVLEEMLSEQTSSGTKASEGSGQIYSQGEEVEDPEEESIVDFSATTMEGKEDVGSGQLLEASSDIEIYTIGRGELGATIREDSSGDIFESGIHATPKSTVESIHLSTERVPKYRGDLSSGEEILIEAEKGGDAIIAKLYEFETSGEVDKSDVSLAEDLFEKSDDNAIKSIMSFNQTKFLDSTTSKSKTDINDDLLKIQDFEHYTHSLNESVSSGDGQDTNTEPLVTEIRKDADVINTVDDSSLSLQEEIEIEFIIIPASKDHYGGSGSVFALEENVNNQPSFSGFGTLVDTDILHPEARSTSVDDNNNLESTGSGLTEVDTHDFGVKELHESDHTNNESGIKLEVSDREIIDIGSGELAESSGEMMYTRDQTVEQELMTTSLYNVTSDKKRKPTSISKIKLNEDLSFRQMRNVSVAFEETKVSSKFSGSGNESVTLDAFYLSTINFTPASKIDQGKFTTSFTNETMPSKISKLSTMEVKSTTPGVLPTIDEVTSSKYPHDKSRITTRKNEFRKQLKNLCRHVNPSLIARCYLQIMAPFRRIYPTTSRSLKTLTTEDKSQQRKTNTTPSTPEPRISDTLSIASAIRVHESKIHVGITSSSSPVPPTGYSPEFIITEKTPDKEDDSMIETVKASIISETPIIDNAKVSDIIISSAVEYDPSKMYQKSISPTSSDAYVLKSDLFKPSKSKSTFISKAEIDKVVKTESHFGLDDFKSLVSVPQQKSAVIFPQEASRHSTMSSLSSSFHQSYSVDLSSKDQMLDLNTAFSTYSKHLTGYHSSGFILEQRYSTTSQSSEKLDFTPVLINQKSQTEIDKVVKTDSQISLDDSKTLVSVSLASSVIFPSKDSRYSIASTLSSSFHQSYSLDLSSEDQMVDFNTPFTTITQHLTENYSPGFILEHVYYATSQSSKNLEFTPVLMYQTSTAHYNLETSDSLMTQYSSPSTLAQTAVESIFTPNNQVISSQALQPPPPPPIIIFPPVLSFLVGRQSRIHESEFYGSMSVAFTHTPLSQIDSPSHFLLESTTSYYDKISSSSVEHVQQFSTDFLSTDTVHTDEQKSSDWYTTKTGVLQSQTLLAGDLKYFQAISDSSMSLTKTLTESPIALTSHLSSQTSSTNFATEIESMDLPRFTSGLKYHEAKASRIDVSSSSYEQHVQLPVSFTSKSVYNTQVASQKGVLSTKIITPTPTFFAPFTTDINIIDKSDEEIIATRNELVYASPFTDEQSTGIYSSSASYATLTSENSFPDQIFTTPLDSLKTHIATNTIDTFSPVPSTVSIDSYVDISPTTQLDMSLASTGFLQSIYTAVSTLIQEHDKASQKTTKPTKVTKKKLTNYTTTSFPTTNVRYFFFTKVLKPRFSQTSIPLTSTLLTEANKTSGTSFTEATQDFTQKNITSSTTTLGLYTEQLAISQQNTTYTQEAHFSSSPYRINTTTDYFSSSDNDLSTSKSKVDFEKIYAKQNVTTLLTTAKLNARIKSNTALRETVKSVTESWFDYITPANVTLSTTFPTTESTAPSTQKIGTGVLMIESSTESENEYRPDIFVTTFPKLRDMSESTTSSLKTEQEARLTTDSNYLSVKPETGASDVEINKYNTNTSTSSTHPRVVTLPLLSSTKIPKTTKLKYFFFTKILTRPKDHSITHKSESAGESFGTTSEFNQTTTVKMLSQDALLKPNDTSRLEQKSKVLSTTEPEQFTVLETSRTKAVWVSTGQASETGSTGSVSTSNLSTKRPSTIMKHSSTTEPSNESIESKSKTEKEDIEDSVKTTQSFATKTVADHSNETVTELPSKMTSDNPSESITVRPGETITGRPQETLSNLSTVSFSETAPIILTKTVSNLSSDAISDRQNETVTEYSSETITNRPTETVTEIATNLLTKTVFSTDTTSKARTDLKTETGIEALTDLQSELATNLSTESVSTLSNDTLLDLPFETVTVTDIPKTSRDYMKNTSLSYQTKSIDNSTVKSTSEAVIFHTLRPILEELDPILDLIINTVTELVTPKSTTGIQSVLEMNASSQAFKLSSLPYTTTNGIASNLTTTADPKANETTRPLNTSFPSMPTHDSKETSKEATNESPHTPLKVIQTTESDRLTSTDVDTTTYGPEETSDYLESIYIKTPNIKVNVNKNQPVTTDSPISKRTTSYIVTQRFIPATIKRSSIRHTIDLTSNNTYPNPRKEIYEYIYNKNISKGPAKLSLKQITVTVIQGAKSLAEQGKQVLLRTYQQAKNITTSITVTVYKRSRQLFKTALDRVEALWKYCESGINHYIVRPLLNARVFIKEKFESAYKRLEETFARGKLIFESTVDNVGKEAESYFDSLATYYTDVYRQYSTEVRDIWESLKIPDS